MDAKPDRPRHPLSHPRAHPRLGINAERGCTDCPVLLLLLIVWAGGLFVAQLAFANGKPANLLRGTDYLANTCGQGDFANMPVLWYPISFNIKTGDLVIKDALKMGLCLAQCPKLGDRVKVYGNLSGTYMPSWWLSLFDSKPKLNRCFPDFATFNCSDSSPTDVANCAKQLLNANNTWSGLSVFEDTFESGFETLQTLWWVVLAGMFIIIALSFLWLALLRHIVKPIVVLTAILVLVAMVGLGYVLWIIKGKKEDLDPPQTDEANYYMYGAIVAWIIAFIYLCVMLFLREDVMTACDIIEEATKVPGDIPTMLLVPPCSFLACIPFFAFFLVVAVYIQSSGEKVTFNLPLSNTLNSTAALFNSVQNYTAISSNTTNLLTQQYSFSNWRIYAHFYNLFVMLWSVGLVGAISFMTVAMCGVFWYWSVPGDKKEPPLGSVCIGMRLVLRYHLGTVALGSFMVALVQLMRVVLAVVEYQMQQVKSKTDATKYIFTCIECMLACLERVIKFINKNGYIMCAMQGTNFVTSARDALNLLAANALSVGALTIISEYVILFGKVLVTVSGVILTWLVLQQVDDSGLKGGWLILFIVLVLGYLISCLFANVFSVCIDTVLLSYCYDKQEEGDDYYPTDLAAHVSKAVLAKGRKIDAITHGEQELKVPLHPGKEKQSGKAVDPLEGL